MILAIAGAQLESILKYVTLENNYVRNIVVTKTLAFIAARDHIKARILHV